MWFYYYLHGRFDLQTAYSFRFQCGSIITLCVCPLSFLDQLQIPMWFYYYCYFLGFAYRVYCLQIPMWFYYYSSAEQTESCQRNTLDSNVVLLLQHVVCPLNQANAVLQIPMWFYYYGKPVTKSSYDKMLQIPMWFYYYAEPCNCLVCSICLQIPMWFYYYTFVLLHVGIIASFRFQCGSIITQTYIQPLPDKFLQIPMWFYYY